MDDANRQHSTVPACQPVRPYGRPPGRLSSIDSFIATDFILNSFDMWPTERRSPVVSLSMLCMCYVWIYTHVGEFDRPASQLQIISWQLCCSRVHALIAFYDRPLPVDWPLSNASKS